MEFLERCVGRQQVLYEAEFRTPRALYENACESIIEYTYVCGSERLQEGYTRKNPRLIFLVVDLSLYLALNVWCIWILWGQLADVIFCMVTAGVALQGFPKIFSYTSKVIYEMHVYNIEFFGKVREYEEVKYRLMRMATFCKLSTKVMRVGYSVLCSTVLLSTIVLSLWTKQFELPFGFFFPWIDRETLFGYLINFLYQVLQLYEAYCGLLGTDICFFCLIMSAIGQLDVMIIYLRKLSELAVAHDRPARIVEINQLLREIIDRHMEYTQYLRKMNRILEIGFLINFGCLIAESVTSLYVLATEEQIWYTGIVIAMAAMIQLFTPCLMGTMLFSKNEQLIREIYNTSWNELPIPAQNVLKLFLVNAQRPVVLSDGFSPIDLFKFVSIYKKIYSYLAMLREFN